MQSKARTPEDYIAELPEERQRAISAIRDEINRNLPPGFEETMGYGMMGWVVPHSLFPPGYHCDPEQALPFMGIGSQKNYISLYHMGLYSDPELRAWFRNAWEEAGVGKLDMGRSCVRLKKTTNIPLALIGELAAKMTPAAWVEIYQASLK